MMKKILLLFYLFGCSLCAFPQSNEVQQLLLNVEKLQQFKQILSDMKKGYQIISNGYGTIKDLSEGNFNLHQVFLDGLMEASPAVRKYHRIAEIGKGQLELIQVTKNAMQTFRVNDLFQPNELQYFTRVIHRVYQQSLQNMDDLLNVLSKGALQMSDAERLAEIDRIYIVLQDQSAFLHYFISEQGMLAFQRQKEINNSQSLRKTYGLSSSKNNQP